MFELVQERTRLEKVENRSAIQEKELASKREQLRDARLVLDIVSKAMLKCADPHDTDTREFTSTDRSFIQRVTGTSLDWCKWNLLDEINAGYHKDILPSKPFEKLFVENSGVICMCKEAGRRTVLHMFLRDVLNREEFGSALRIFHEFEFLITSTEDSRLIRLSGKADYTIGHSAGKDIFDCEPSKELHLIAAEANRDWPDESYWECIAQIAALHKSRKQAGKKKCQTWGILSNATNWKFLSIDETGQLSTSEDFKLELRSYNEKQVLAVYRAIYSIVKSCYEASPPSTPEKKHRS